MSRRLKAILGTEFSEEEVELLVGSYDVVGDIAIIIVPDSLIKREQEIGRALMQINRRIKVVAKRTGHYGGEFRTIKLEIIAGEPRKETEVKEFGLRFLLNPETVYFSVRSGNERKRIASLVQDCENVLVLFSGIGPFPLIISKYSKARSIVGIEKNRMAHAYALRNVQINKGCNNIQLYCGDVIQVVPELKRSFERVVMVLPKGGELFLPVAIKALKRGGSLHYYDMQKVDLFDDSITKVIRAARRQQREVETTTVTKCGHCAPQTYRICVDACIY